MIKESFERGHLDVLLQHQLRQFFEDRTLSGVLFEDHVELERNRRRVRVGVVHHYFRFVVIVEGDVFGRRFSRLEFARQERSQSAEYANIPLQLLNRVMQSSSLGLVPISLLDESFDLRALFIQLALHVVAVGT